MKVFRTRATVLFALVALTAAACGASTTEAASGEGAGASPFDGEFATLDGGSVDLAEFEGQDVVLWFWAPW